MNILRSATSVNAEIVQHPGELGCIREGARADLCAWRDDPLKDLSTIWDTGPSLVVKGGKVEAAQL
jgi:imidazolonepropionase-like amidohydrolase